MSMDYHQQRAWADNFLTWQLGVLNRHLPDAGRFVVANDRQDMKQNTDAISAGGVRACLRMRSWERTWRYLHQFTIRGYNGGYDTEFDKLGWPDYMLYSVERPDRAGVHQYFIGRMKVLQPYVDSRRESLRRRLIYNTDNKTGLIPFDINEIPSIGGKSWVVADSGTGFFRNYRQEFWDAWDKKNNVAQSSKVIQQTFGFKQ